MTNETGEIGELVETPQSLLSPDELDALATRFEADARVLRLRADEKRIAILAHRVPCPVENAAGRIHCDESDEGEIVACARPPERRPSGSVLDLGSPAWMWLCGPANWWTIPPTITTTCEGVIVKGYPYETEAT